MTSRNDKTVGPKRSPRPGNIWSNAPPQHVLDQFIDVQRFDFDGLEAAAVAKNRDPIRNLKNLSQAMSDVNDRSTFAGEFAHHRLDLLDLNVG